MQTLKLTKKYEKYPEYKDSGVEWLGKIPKDWVIYRAKNLFMKMNRTPEKSDDIVTAFRDGIVTLRKNRREDGFTMADKEIGYQRILKGDLVIHGMDAFAGAIGVSDSDGKSSPVYSVCIPTHGSNTRYHAYLLRHMSKSNYIFALAKGIRERSTEFRFKEFGNLEISEPPIKEQEKIVKYLDEKTSSIDQIIEKKQKLIELLREKRTAVINHAVTKGLDSKVELVDSNVDWIGNMPAGWKLDKIKRATFINKKTLSESTNSDFSFKYFDIGSVDEEEVSNIESEITFEKAPSRARRIVSVGDSIIATVRTYLKAIAYFDKLDTETIASTGFAVLTPKKELIPKYLFYYLQSDRFINQVIIKSKGIGYPAITPFDLGSLEIIYPNKITQNSIVAYLDENIHRFNSIIEKAEKSIKILSEFKSSLIANVVTGKIKV